MRTTRRVAVVASALLIVTSGWSQIGGSAQMPFNAHVDSEGHISLPRDFRTSMVHLGSWFVPEGEASGFHDVYTEPETVVAFRQTGVFPDGATLVKELRAHTTGRYTTGADVSHANGTLKQWFVMIKDREGRFEEHPLWDHGWGWALFSADDPSTNVATSVAADCLTCHLPARDTDWVYIEAYPSLHGPSPPAPAGR